MKKIIIAFILSITLLFLTVITSVNAEETNAFTVKVDDVVVTAGDSQVAVDILLENNPGIAGFSFCVNFDTDKLVLVESKINIEDGHKVIAQPTGYGVNLAWTSASGYTEDGSIATLYFNIPKDIEASEASVEIVYRDGYDSFYDSNEEDFVVQTVNGKITITTLPETSLPSVSISEVSANLGETDIVVPITIKNNPGIAGFSFCVDYDTSRLVLKSADVLIDNGYEVIGYPEEYGVNIAWTSTETYAVDGTIVELHFSLTDNANLGNAFINILFREDYDSFYNFTDGQEKDIVIESFNGYVDVNEFQEEVTAEIVRKGQTLEYKNVIFVKVIYDLVNVDLSEVDIKTDAGMLCWTEEEFLALESVEFDEEHALVGLEQYSGTDYYYGKSEGIYTRYLADESYYVGYVKLADGTYIYSEPKLYGPTTYAYNMINKDSSSEQTKELCVALLNYIAAAQSYFYSDTLEEELANADLSEEQKQLDWNIQTLNFNLAPEISDEQKVEQDTTVFQRMGKTLRFQEMISLVSIYQIEDSYIEEAEECGTIFWTAEEFAKLSGQPSLDNYGNGQKVDIETYGSTNMWCSVAPAVAAKDMADTCYYILGYVKHSDGTVSYSGVDSYSFEQYIYNTTTGTTASEKMIAFAQRLYVYERAANVALK